jgi:hypothetical protein
MSKIKKEQELELLELLKDWNSRITLTETRLESLAETYKHFFELSDIVRFFEDP